MQDRERECVCTDSSNCNELFWKFMKPKQIAIASAYFLLRSCLSEREIRGNVERKGNKATERLRERERAPLITEWLYTLNIFHQNVDNL